MYTYSNDNSYHKYIHHILQRDHDGFSIAISLQDMMIVITTQFMMLITLNISFMITTIAIDMMINLIAMIMMSMCWFGEDWGRVRGV